MMLKMLDCWGVTLCCWTCSSDVFKDCCGFIVKAKAFLFSGLCDPEDDGTMILRNTGNYVLSNKASYPTKIEALSRYFSCLSSCLVLQEVWWI